MKKTNKLFTIVFRNLAILLLLVLIFCSFSIQAQVTIGAGEDANKGALLDVKESHKTDGTADSEGGMGLPRVELNSLDTKGGSDLKTTINNTTGLLEAWDVNDHIGLTVYHIGNVDICAGVYVWNGAKWVRIPKPCDVPNVAGEGVGYFTGKICFDIAKSNLNDNKNGCALLTDRTDYETDFIKNNPTDKDNPNTDTRPSRDRNHNGLQVYRFWPVGTVSYVRFFYEDPSGKVIETITPEADYNKTNIASECEVVVKYRSSLENDAEGLTYRNPLRAKLIVVYNDKADGTGVDRKLDVKVRIQDCACCGAWVEAVAPEPFGWRWMDFMCHNLGANEDTDPFSNEGLKESLGPPNWNIDEWAETTYDVKGGLYQWGRTTDGHEQRDSPFREDVLYTDTIPNDNGFVSFTAADECRKAGDGVGKIPWNGAVYDYDDPTQYIEYWFTSPYNEPAAYVGIAECEINRENDWLQDGGREDVMLGALRRWNYDAHNLYTTQDKLNSEDHQDYLTRPKAKQDPCPYGWKVPSSQHYQAIYAGVKYYAANKAEALTTAVANDYKMLDDTTDGGYHYYIGLQIGAPKRLYLPVTGWRYASQYMIHLKNISNLYGVGATDSGGWYWTSEVDPSRYYKYPWYPVGSYDWNDQRPEVQVYSKSKFFKFGHDVHEGNPGVILRISNSRTDGMAVRCVLDDYVE